MDVSCYSEDCECAENYCEDSSYSPVYFCNFKKSEKAHKGHFKD